MGLVEDVQVEARCRSLVEAITLPDPFSLQGLVQNVSEQCGRPIDLRPLPSYVPAEITATVFPFPDRYILFYPERVDHWFRLVTICHELGHIVGKHFGCNGQIPAGETSVLAPAVIDQREDAAVCVVTATAASLLDAAVVPSDDQGNGLLGLPELFAARDRFGALLRCSMSEDIEVEAELIATFLMQRLRPLLSGVSRRPDSSAVLIFGASKSTSRHVEATSRYAAALAGRPGRRWGTPRRGLA